VRLGPGLRSDPASDLELDPAQAYKRDDQERDRRADGVAGCRAFAVVQARAGRSCPAMRGSVPALEPPRLALGQAPSSADVDALIGVLQEVVEAA
jgi:hypothetical protein